MDLSDLIHSGARTVKKGLATAPEALVRNFGLAEAILRQGVRTISEPTKRELGLGGVETLDDPAARRELGLRLNRKREAEANAAADRQIATMQGNINALDSDIARKTNPDYVPSRLQVKGETLYDADGKPYTATRDGALPADGQQLAEDGIGGPLIPLMAQQVQLQTPQAASPQEDNEYAAWKRQADTATGLSQGESDNEYAAWKRGPNSPPTVKAEGQPAAPPGYRWVAGGNPLEAGIPGSSQYHLEKDDEPADKRPINDKLADWVRGVADGLHGLQFGQNLNLDPLAQGVGNAVAGAVKDPGTAALETLKTLDGESALRASYDSGVDMENAFRRGDALGAISHYIKGQTEFASPFMMTPNTLGKALLTPKTAAGLAEAQGLGEIISAGSSAVKGAIGAADSSLVAQIAPKAKVGVNLLPEALRPTVSKFGDIRGMYRDQMGTVDGANTASADLLPRLLRNAGVPPEVIEQRLPKLMEHMREGSSRADINTAIERTFSDYPDVMRNARGFILSRGLDASKGGKTVVESAVDDLRGTQAAHLNDEISRILGGQPKIEAEGAIKQTLRNIGEEGFNRILKDADSAPELPGEAMVLQNLLAKEPAASGVLQRRALNAGYADTGGQGGSTAVEKYIKAHPFEAAHWVQSDLDEAARTAVGAERANLNGAVSSLRDWLKKGVPGYAKAQEEYAKEIGAREALGYTDLAKVVHPGFGKDKLLPGAKEAYGTDSAKAEYGNFDPRQASAADLDIRDALTDPLRGTRAHGLDANNKDVAGARMIQLQSSGLVDDALPKVLGERGTELADIVREAIDERVRLANIDPRTGSNTFNKAEAAATGGTLVSDGLGRLVMGEPGVTQAADATLALTGNLPVATIGKKVGGQIFRATRPFARRQNDLADLLLHRPNRGASGGSGEPVPPIEPEKLADIINGGRVPAPKPERLPVIEGKVEGGTPPPAKGPPPTKLNSPEPMVGGTPEARARAKADGFDVDTTLYHGTTSEFDAFAGPTYLTTNPEYATDFAWASDAEMSAQGFKPNIVPAYVRGSYKAVDQKTIEWLTSDPEAITVLRGQGYDGVKSPDGQVLVFDPKNIRSIHAKFDPAKRDGAKLDD